MTIHPRAILVWTSVWIMLTAAPAIGQLDTAGKGPDELFVLARTLAVQGERAQARTVLHLLLQRAPEYDDARILLARTHAWDGQYDTARAILENALKRNPALLDACTALSDVNLWSSRFDQALAAAQSGLRLFPQDDQLLLRKARALHGLDRDADALTILDSLVRHPVAGSEARAFRSEVQHRAPLHMVTLTYGVDSYATSYSPMHIIAAAGETRTSGGIVGLRVTTVRRFNATGAQIEGEFYPVLSRAIYGYLDYGYSPSGLFPRHRLGAEVFSRLSSQIEASVGGRAFLFPGESAVVMGTGTATLYTGSFYLSLRPFFTFRDKEWATSGVLTLRYYTEENGDYLFARIGSGFSADERWLQSSNGFSGRGVYFLASGFAGLGVIHSVGNGVALAGDVSYTRQELGFSLGKYVAVYSATFGVRVRL